MIEQQKTAVSLSFVAKDKRSILGVAAQECGHEGANWNYFQVIIASKLQRVTRQLAAYSHVLARVYPDRTVDCALLWTDAPELMVIPQAMLDRAWQAALFTSPQPGADPA